MLYTLLKRTISVLMLTTFGSSAPWAVPNPKMTEYNSAMTRQRLNELLQQTPSLPTSDKKQPVRLS